MKARLLILTVSILAVVILSGTARAGQRELVGRLDGREVFRLEVCFGHPPFPGVVTLSTPQGTVLCTAELFFDGTTGNFSCTLPDRRVLSMTVTRNQDGRGVWMAQVGGRALTGQLRQAR